VPSQAIQEQPAVNAVIDGDDIVYRDYVDISVAVSSPKGLVVPVSWSNPLRALGYCQACCAG
jgi:pyruvate/2-oxoglutarate dehydrogenase complex dihydrolipoamide acyltransferase (E2) component